MVQTVYCYYFTAHSATCALDTEVYPFEDKPQHIMDTIRPLEPVSWSSVPLALRITFPDASSHALRLTLRRRRLPHGAQQFAPDGSPVYPKVTGSDALHCFWCYTSAHTCRPIAWLLPVKTGLCPRFRRNTQRVLRLILPTSGTDPLEQDGFMVELLPKLAFFTLWDRPPSAGLARGGTRDSSEGRLPIGGPIPAETAESPEPMGGGAGPAVLSPADADPAEEAQAPIDLVSDTSASAGSQSDSDDSSVVAVIEPTDQAAAEVPCVVDLMAATDFTQHLLNDPHAPMITVSLEEQALAPARVLARLPYLEHLLGLVQQGCAPAQLPAACAPALAQAHADLATYLATVIVGLFDPARLGLVPEALADDRKLGDPNVVARALLAQINYTADVAANMPPHTYTTASGIFRFAWRGQQKSTTIVLRLRTVYMYLPASCLRSPPPDTQLPTLAAASFPTAAPSPVAYLLARWKFEYPLSLPGPFVEWYMSRLRFGPRLMAVCAQLRISAHLLEHSQIPNCVPLCRSVSRWRGPRRALPFPSQQQRFFGLARLSRHYLPPVAASGEKDESEVRTSRTVQKG